MRINKKVVDLDQVLTDRVNVRVVENMRVS